jgi:hypothetical protein
MATQRRSSPAGQVTAGVAARKVAAAPKPRKAAPKAPRLADATEADRLRHAAIAEAAYLMAQGRDFAPGHELEDWLRAEADFKARNGAS